MMSGNTETDWLAGGGVPCLYPLRPTSRQPVQFHLQCPLTR